MLATPTDRFRISCVIQAATFAAFFIAPIDYNYPSKLCLAGLATSWLICTYWTLSAYSKVPGQGLSRQTIRFFWLTLCMALSIETSLFVAGQIIVDNLLIAPDFAHFIKSCT